MSNPTRLWGIVRRCVQTILAIGRVASYVEIQLQRQIAGIASRYHGMCPYQARHTTFILGTNRFRLGSCRFVRCKTGSSSSRTDDHSLDHSRVVLAQKPGPRLSTCRRPCTERVAIFRQLRTDKSSGAGEGKHFFSHCANGFPSFAGRRWRHAPFNHFAKSRCPQFGANDPLRTRGQCQW